MFRAIRMFWAKWRMIIARGTGPTAAIKHGLGERKERAEGGVEHGRGLGTQFCTRISMGGR